MPHTEAQPDAGKLPAADLPDDLSEFDAYGLWDGLNVYDSHGDLAATVKTHPGRFFPGSPSHYVEALREAVLSGQQQDYRVWPVRADIDITQSCTNSCGFCYAQLYAREPLYHKAQMAPGDFESIVVALKEGGTRVVRFTGGGEPLLHPAFEDMVKLPRLHGLRSCVITNGTLLDDSRDRLLVENVDLVRVSINAGTDDTWQRLHRPLRRENCLPDILAHVEKMARLRRQLRPYTRQPLIWLTYLVLPENAHEIPQAARAARDCGADSIAFRSVYHQQRNPWVPDTYNPMTQQLVAAARLHDPPTFQVFTPKTPLWEVWERKPQEQGSPCHKCRLVTIIEATRDGSQVKLCDVHRGMSGDVPGRAGECLGTLGPSTTFGDVWNAAHARGLLADRPKRCGEHCIAFTFNETIAQIWRSLVQDPGAVFRRCNARPVGYPPLPPMEP